MAAKNNKLIWILQKAAFAAVLSIFAFIQLASTGYALSTEQKRIFDSGIYYFDTASSDGACFSGSEDLPESVPKPYNTIFSQAAGAYKTNVQLLAAIYLTENGNNWKPINSSWATSPAGASGPFQFMPATWDAYKVDGNNDGVIDINNIYDAAFSAAHLIYSYNARPNTPLGSLEQPLQTNTLLQISASYNAGPGNVQRWGSTASLTDLYKETQDYVSNVYALITSGFTKSGKASYPDPRGSGGGSITAGTGCSSGVVAGSVVNTALNLAWPTYGHCKDKGCATPEYQAAMPKYNGSSGYDVWSDCGVFVATVMIASGADTSYPKRSTFIQSDYVRTSGKYVIINGVRDSSQLQPGDILLYNGSDGGHTFIYTGKQTDFNGDSASASLGDHVPEAVSAASSFAYNNRAISGNYFVARLK